MYPGTRIDYTGWYPSTSDIPITFFNGTYSVPDTPAPEYQGSEVLYWFIGMQNNADSETRILQPVLTFNGPQGGAEGEPEGWSFTSWNCCPSGQAWYSSPITGKYGPPLVYHRVAINSANSVLTPAPFSLWRLRARRRSLRRDGRLGGPQLLHDHVDDSGCE